MIQSEALKLKFKLLWFQFELNLVSYCLLVTSIRNSDDFSFIHPSIHYLRLASPLQVPLRDSWHSGLIEPRPVGRGNLLWITYTQGHGRSPQMRDQLNAGATSETTQTWKTIHTIDALILSRRIWKDDYDGFLTFVLQVRKNPEKPHPGNLSRPGIEPGPAAWQARMLPPVPQRWKMQTICIWKLETRS